MTNWIPIPRPASSISSFTKRKVNPQNAFFVWGPGQSEINSLPGVGEPFPTMSYPQAEHLMHFPSVVTKQAEINAAVSEVIRLLEPDVVHIRYDIGQDWSGDWAIFFRVVLSDEASRKPRLREVATEVVRRLSDRLDFSSMGLFPYHNFRSVSEQAVLREEAWA
jgi:hypothetical protein